MKGLTEIGERVIPPQHEEIGIPLSVPVLRCPTGKCPSFTYMAILQDQWLMQASARFCPYCGADMNKELGE